MVTLRSGDVIAGGRFTTAGGAPANRIALWNGTVWSPIGTGMNGPVNAIRELPNGDLIAAGSFTTAGSTAANNIARWDGSNWFALASGLNNGVNGMTIKANGDVVVGGYFTAAGSVTASRVAKWDGTFWSALGGGLQSPLTPFAEALTTLPNDDIVVCGAFTNAFGVPARGIARWDGIAWHTMGTWRGGLLLQKNALQTLPNGDVLVAGSFTTAATTPANSIARWDGVSWSALGSGIDGHIFDLTTMPNGDVVVAGAFHGAGGLGSVNIARLTTTCPATTASLGGGCASTGGSNTLAGSLPWMDSTWQATGTGLPALSLVAFVNSFTAISLPLATVLAQGMAGCTLLVSPDHVTIVTPSNGVTYGELVLPNTPTLIGGTYYSQMVPFELDASLNITAVTATNVLALTIGAF